MENEREERIRIWLQTIEETFFGTSGIVGEKLLQVGEHENNLKRKVISMFP